MKHFLFAIVVLTAFPLCALGQTAADKNYSGSWLYAISDTPYGDFSGVLNLKKNKDLYTGEIVNSEGIRYRVDVKRCKGARLVFASNFEESKAMFYCYFKEGEDVLRGTIEVDGDDYLYLLKATKQLVRQ